MKLIIESDGTTSGTRVKDYYTGETVGWIRKIIWEVSSEDVFSKTTIEIYKLPLSVSVDDVKVVNVDPTQKSINE